MKAGFSVFILCGKLYWNDSIACHIIPTRKENEAREAQVVLQLGLFRFIPSKTSIMEFPPLSEYRCDCGKLLFKGALLVSLVEVKCKRCGRISTFKGREKDEILLASLLIRGEGL